MRLESSEKFKLKIEKFTGVYMTGDIVILEKGL